jgi:hypothetical protein
MFRTSEGQSHFVSWGSSGIRTSHGSLTVPNPTTTSASGWYADPQGTDQLRYWDGTHWTHHVRPARLITAPPGAPDEPSPEVMPGPTTPGPSDDAAVADRHRNITTIVLGIVIMFFAVAGFYEVVAGNSSSNSNPNRFAGDTGSNATNAGGPTTTLLPSKGVNLNCTEIPKSADATTTVHRLASKGLPVEALITAPGSPAAAPTTVQPTSPSSAPNAALARRPCSETAFRDARDPVANELLTYPSIRVAAVEAQAVRASGHPAFAVGLYVVRLDAGLQPHVQDYEKALDSLAAADAPTTTAPPPSLPQPAGSS